MSREVNNLVDLSKELDLDTLFTKEEQEELINEWHERKFGHMRKWFSWTPAFGFTYHKTAEEAKERAEQLIEECLADDRGWDEEVGDTCWGEVMQQAIETNYREDPMGEFDYVVDYVLMDSEDIDSLEEE